MGDSEDGSYSKLIYLNHSTLGSGPIKKQRSHRPYVTIPSPFSEKSKLAHVCLRFGYRIQGRSYWTQN
jgi:hypothetical protein